MPPAYALVQQLVEKGHLFNEHLPNRGGTGGLHRSGSRCDIESL